MSNHLLARFNCNNCSAEFAEVKNESNKYLCPYCDTQHSSAFDDTLGKMEELTYKQLLALILTTSKIVLADMTSGDYNKLAVTNSIIVDAQKILQRYENVADKEELDRLLQNQFEVQRKRIIESGDDTFYNFDCSQCGAPIHHKPENRFEEIICPTCGGNVAFNIEGKVPTTKSAIHQDDKGQQLMKVAAEMNKALEAGDMVLHKKLEDKYTELSIAFAANFDWSKHKEVKAQTDATMESFKESAEQGIKNIEEVERLNKEEGLL